MKISLDSLQEAIKYNMIGSCTCGTKTPEVAYHNRYCLYSTLARANDVINYYRKTYPTGVDYIEHDAS